MKRTLLTFITVWVLLGCSTPSQVLPTMPLAPVNLSSEVYTLCSRLDDAPITTFEGALLAYAELSKAYIDCAIKQYNSTKLLKEFSGYTEELANEN